MAEGPVYRECQVKFLLDECLPHKFAKRLSDRGYPDSIHPIHVGLRAKRDDALLLSAIDDDRIIITNNARDYRALLARAEIHPDAIMLPNAEREQSWRLIEAALVFIELQLSPADYMINRVVEVSASEGIRPYLLAKED